MLSLVFGACSESISYETLDSITQRKAPACGGHLFLSTPPITTSGAIFENVYSQLEDGISVITGDCQMVFSTGNTPNWENSLTDALDIDFDPNTEAFTYSLNSLQMCLYCLNAYCGQTLYIISGENNGCIIGTFTVTPGNIYATGSLTGLTSLKYCAAVDCGIDGN